MALPHSVRSDAQVLGDRLRRWRLVRDLSAAVVAERAGISLSSLRLIEKGDGENVRIGALLSVARVLGVNQELLDSVEPFNSEIGRLRADRMLRQRARP